MALELYNNQKIQSKQLYCQAAGSDGSDGSIEGNHIRWSIFDYNRRLYYPMGDFSPDPFEDYVNLYQHQFEEGDLDEYSTILRPLESAPGFADAASAVWTYEYFPFYSQLGEFEANAMAGGMVNMLDSNTYTFMLAAEVNGTLKPLGQAVTVQRAETEDDIQFTWTDVQGAAYYRLYWLDSHDFNGNYAYWDIQPGPNQALWVQDILTLDPDAINPPKTALPQEEKKGVNNAIILTFLDKQQYSSLTGQYDPYTQYADIIENYTGAISVEILNKPAFAFVLEMESTSGTYSVNIETVSEINLDGNSAYTTSSRKQHNSVSSPDTAYVYEENIVKAIFQCNSCKPVKINLACYTDFIVWATANNQWTELGSFGLTDNDTTVGNRLMPNDIDDAWPRFRDGKKVKASNYQSKWSDTVNGLKKLVTNYVNDPEGSEIYTETPNLDDTEIEIFYADVMDLISFDYHAARMLGLGHIEPYTGTNRYIYLAEYLNEELINPSASSAVQHLYMSLPTGTSDSRLSVAPSAASPTYGVIFSDTSENPPKVTDNNGYSIYEDARFINLNISNSSFYPELTPFNTNGPQFSLGSSSVPVYSSAYYREQGQSWEVPDDLKDDEYQNSDNSDELVLLPFRSGTLLTHKLIEEGTFEYALFSINWFSRPSDLSSTISTGQTSFPVRNTLMPPVNFNAVYIQEEDPLIITSQYDQNRLADYKSSLSPGADYGLTRVTFEWNENHFRAYRFADKVEFLFKTNEPASISGVIKSTVPVGTDRIKVVSGSYALTIGNVTVSPELNFASDEHERFIGSYLISGKNQFPILDILEPEQTGDGPGFIIQKIKLVTGEDEEKEGDYKPSITYLVPVAGELFSVPENLNTTGNWDKILAKQVELIQFSTTTEPVKTGDTTTKDLLVSGIAGAVTIAEILDGTNRTGVYEALFSGNPLTAHPDSDVSWYKGSARVPTSLNNDILRSLEVWQITTDANSNLKLVIYDPFFQDSAVEIGTGANITIHFHPGYRVYLKPETGFGKDQIVPGQGERIRKTLLTGRSLDTTRSYSSAIANPSLIMGREIIEAAPVEEPLGAVFATRPDYYGMSSYTFAAQINTDGGRTPFGMLFHKANEGSILNALYLSETVKDIYENLGNPVGDVWFTTRWYELVNCITDVNGLFNEFNGYAFPNPDNNATDPDFDGATAPGTLVEDIKAVIRSVFTPMTSTPVIYDHVKPLSTHPLSPKDPVLKAVNGTSLAPSDSLFDPFPMVRKYTDTGNTFLKFTDYKLDGASNNFYFYYAVELDSNFKIDYGKSSPISKPIRLLNIKPAGKPGIKQIRTIPADPYASVLPGVQFEVNPYLPDEQVSKVKIFRTLNHADALSMRSMVEAVSVDIDGPLIDNFADFDFPPFGELIYYRLCAVREVLNEDEVLEEVLSMPSEIVMANVIDVINPEPPEISYTVGSTTSAPEILHDVELSWEPTAYNGKYYLYKMTSSGNWQKLDEQVSNSTMTYELDELLKEVDGETIYHHFKVEVENANGLLSIVENALVI
ncbi:MAG TPA: hypothetical protein DIW47_07690 [Bacteroidetes bacterium]|nr:hypothetical protein [Bacteroidota bacterium]